MRNKIILSRKEENQIKKFLLKEISSRQLGKAIGRSHQGAINLISTIVIQWLFEKKLKFVK